MGRGESLVENERKRREEECQWEQKKRRWMPRVEGEGKQRGRVVQRGKGRRVTREGDGVRVEMRMGGKRLIRKRVWE